MARGSTLEEKKVAEASRREAAPAALVSRPVERRAIVARVLPHLLALAGFSAATVVATWPMLPRLGGFVVNQLDPLYSVWAMAWQAHALATNPAGLFDTNVMYPFSGTLAFDELSFAQAVISAPLYWLSGNPVLSHNAQLLLTFILSAYGMWLLVRELTGSGAAGAVAGAAYAFSFYRFNHLPHMTLLSTQWLPFMLLAAYKLMWSGSWRWAGALGAFFTVQALSSHYLAFYSVILLGLFVLYYLATERRSVTLRFLGKLGAALAVSLLAMLPVIVPYVRVQASYEFTRGLFEVERYSATLPSFLAVYQGNPLYRALLAPFADPGPWPWERAAFPGLGLLLLAAVGVIGAWRGRTSGDADVSRPTTLRRHAGFFAVVALLSAFLALGPTLQVAYPASSYDPNAINGVLPLPYALLHEWVPGFQSMRVVARITVLVTLGLSALAGVGALLLLRGVGERLRGGATAQYALPVLAGLMAIVPIVESWSAPVQLEPIGTRGAVPEVYRWLAEQPKTAVLEYPMVLVESRRGPENVAMANRYQYYSAYHWQRVVNGSTTIKPASYSALVRETEDCFPCPRSLDALWALGVEYVVAHLENLTEPQKTEFLWRAGDPAGKVVGEFALVREFGSDRVYRLKPRAVGQLAEVVPEGASILLADPWLDPLREGDENSYIGGGYVAALGHYLRDHPLYGNERLSFGQPVRAPDPNNPPDYALLWARQDPATAGYLVENRVWANEHVALYKRGPGIAASRREP